VREALARGWSLDQFPHLRNPQKRAINREIPGFLVPRPPSLFELRRGSLRHHWLAEPKLRSSEGWRPGLDLNQDKEHCTAPASTHFRHRADPIIADQAGAGHA